MYTVEPGFRALGAELESVHSYTDANCTSCGSCIQGCPSNAGKSTMNTYIADALARGVLELRANAAVEQVLTDGSEATGVEYVDESGERHTVHAGAVVVAGGALNTPQLLIRSGLENASIGRHLGVHPVRLVYGLFDEPQDAHMVYPITAHCVNFQHDEDGGYVIEATTIQDPISFATTLSDENGPLWGRVSSRRCAASGTGSGSSRWRTTTTTRPSASARTAWSGSRSTSSRPSRSASTARSGSVARSSRQRARRRSAGPVSCPPVQGSCRMGDDPARSVVDRNGESHDVKRLFVGDGSLVPRTLSVNPSLTIMGARDAARGAPGRRPERLPRPAGSRDRSRMRAALLSE